jgi:hypothetical protein
MRSAELHADISTYVNNDPADTIEVAVELEMRGLMLATQSLDEYRRSNAGRQALIDNRGDLELTRDMLSRMLDDVGGFNA